MSYLHELFAWVIYMSYLHELFTWVISMSYLHELFTRAIYTSYLHELFTRVIYPSYLHELFTRVIYTSYLHELFTWVIYFIVMDGLANVKVSQLSFSFIIKPTRCTNFPNLLRHETLHVSGSSSAHHQEFIHCTFSNGIVIQVCRQLSSRTRV